MQNVRLSIAWLIAGVSLCALGLLLVTGQPCTAKAQVSLLGPAPDAMQVREHYINPTGVKMSRGQAFPSGTVMVMELYTSNWRVRIL